MNFSDETTHATAAAAAFSGGNPSAAVVAAVSQWWASARAAWPGAACDSTVLFELVGRLSGRRLDRAAALNINDLFLARASLAGDRTALHLLDSSVFTRARSILRGVGDDDFLNEVAQVSREHLLIPLDGNPPKLDSYTGAGSLVNWVRAVMYRRAMTMKRLSPDRGSPEALAVLPSSNWSAELQFIKAVHRRAFAEAFAEAFSSLDARERSLLHANLVEEVSIDVLGERFGTHRATVARWIVQAKARLSRGVEQLLKTKLDVGKTEYDAMLGSLEQNLQISLGRLIQQGTAG